MTGRGGQIVGAGLAFLLAWLILGEIELLAAGAAMLVAAGAALVMTRLTRPRIEVTRWLEPSTVHEGDRASVNLAIANQRRAPAFAVTVEDGVSGLGAARFQIGKLPANGIASATYHIACRSRGIYTVGPAQAAVSDPFGLATSVRRSAIADRLVVYPAIEALSGFPPVRGRDPAMSASRPEFSRRGGEDFYTLRSYQEGDDLRRVHWASSAKLDELMIRQMETPWQSRALVFFDVRRKSYESSDAFERAVRGTASVTMHLAGSFAGDLWLGSSLIDLSAPAMAFEELATVQPLPAIDLRAVAARIRRQSRGGALVLITGTPDEEILAVIRLLSQHYRVGVMLAAADRPGRVLNLVQQLSIKTVVAGTGETWAHAWAQSLGRAQNVGRAQGL
jgi:uncharacterized protein (DUF58 family)